MEWDSTPKSPKDGTETSFKFDPADAAELGIHGKK
jgi:hypothetical protein